MKLISCESCGVVLDTDQITAEIEESEYCADEVYFWCPCCKDKIDYLIGTRI
jgi:hypothetical protein